MVPFAAVIIVSAIASLVICATFAAYVAEQKGRPQLEGVLLGFFLGVFGLVIEALMPTLATPAPVRPRTETIAPGRAPRRRDRARCPACQSETATTARFCAACGADLEASARA